MKIELRDLGPIKQAELEIKDLTIISGANNSGKTYVSYTLCGFFLLWRQFISFNTISRKIYSQLVTEGQATIDPDSLLRSTDKLLSEACLKYSEALHRILAGTSKHLEDNFFSYKTEDLKLLKTRRFEKTATRAKKSIVRVSYEGGDNPIKINLLSDLSQISDPHETARLATDFLDQVLKDELLAPVFPQVFIASAERTGATIFQKELDIARNRLIEKIGESAGSSEIDLFRLAFQISNDYALPVKQDIDFIRGVEGFSKEQSELIEQFPDILDDFHNIIGGEYKITKNEGIRFIPKGTRGVKLTMGESSSAVRSLFNIGSYIRHKAAKGDLLIIDEPELNLHPENQRKVARLIARLVNAGIKIFITTHSDYLIKELNTLIMLSADGEHFQTVRDEEGYRSDETIEPNKLSVYQAAKRPCKFGDMKRAVSGMTLVSADINQEQGIWIESFDQQIEEMDRIQSKILYGND